MELSQERYSHIGGLEIFVFVITEQLKINNNETVQSSFEKKILELQKDNIITQKLFIL